mgnify:FL=1
MRKVCNILAMVVMLLGAATWQSCSTTYSSEDFIPDDDKSRNEEEYGSYAIAVTLNYNSLLYSTTSGLPAAGAKTSVIESKGQGAGAFDTKNNKERFDSLFEASKFYILAYRKTVNTEGDLNTQPNFTYLMNSAENVNFKDCLLSTERTSYNGTTTAAQYQAVGKVAMPVEKGGSLKLLSNTTWESKPASAEYRSDYEVETTHFWSKDYPKTGYNFFAYYTNNAEIYSTTATEERVSMEVELDGTNDIMVGVAPEVTDSLLKTDFGGSVTESDIRKKIIEYGDGAYSTWGAVHSVQPKINMKHCLTQLLFDVILLDSTADITINNIRVKMPRRGNVIVASRNPREIGLTTAVDTAYTQISGDITKKALIYNETTRIGSGMLLPPSDEFQVALTMTENGLKETIDGASVPASTQTRYATVHVDGGFKAGVTYYLKVSLYASTGIDIKASLNPWQYGGEATVVTPEVYERYNK